MVKYLIMSVMAEVIQVGVE